MYPVQKSYISCLSNEHPLFLQLNIQSDTTVPKIFPLPYDKHASLSYGVFVYEIVDAVSKRATGQSLAQ